MCFTVSITNNHFHIPTSFRVWHATCVAVSTVSVSSALLVKHRGVSGYYRYVCTDQWTSAFSDAVCRQLGHEWANLFTCTRGCAYIMHTLLHARSRSSLVYTIQSTEWPRSLHSVKWIALSAPSPSLHTSYLSEELIILRDFSTLYIDDPGNIVLKYRRVMKAEDESAIRLSYDERYNANKSVRLICSQVYQGWILMIWMISRKRWNHIS